MTSEEGAYTASQSNTGKRSEEERGANSFTESRGFCWNRGNGRPASRLGAVRLNVVMFPGTISQSVAVSMPDRWQPLSAVQMREEVCWVCELLRFATRNVCDLQTGLQALRTAKCDLSAAPDRCSCRVLSQVIQRPLHHLLHVALRFAGICLALGQTAKLAARVCDSQIRYAHVSDARTSKAQASKRERIRRARQFGTCRLHGSSRPTRFEE